MHMNKTRRHFFAGMAGTLSLIIGGFSGQLAAADLHIFAGDSFEIAVENLNPGDTLTVHEGTYTDTGRISISVVGSAQQPTVIQGADGEQRPHITRVNGSPLQNTINIEGAQYLTIKGLEISSNGIAGDGINLGSNPSNITLEDLVIHDITVGVNFTSSMHHITVRKNHIYRTYDTGEGMYVGCNNAACAVTESLIEENWINDTMSASQGDGIEIKHGSHSNIIRNNVIHDTHWPCIILYGTVGNPQNIVEGNVMWNCGASGIQAAADAVIRNNIILDSPGDGFNSQPHQGATPNNLQFVHNTVVGGNPCVRLHDWNNKTGLVFANNAMYCDAESFNVSGLSGVAVKGNVFIPAMSAFPATGYTIGRSSAQDFIDHVNRQVYPTSDSALRGAGDPAYATTADFNGTARNGDNDVGAYTWTTAANPGWLVAPGFKDSVASPPPPAPPPPAPPPPPPPPSPEPEPTVSMSATALTVSAGSSTTLNWSSTDASSCEASGAWSGSKSTSGSQTVGPLSLTGRYTLTCSGTGGSGARALTVTVVDDGSGGGTDNGDNPGDGDTPAPDETPTENAEVAAESASSALDPLFIVALLLAGRVRRLTTIRSGKISN